MPGLVDACTDRWYNQTLCHVDESVVRLGIVRANIIGTRTTTRMYWKVKLGYAFDEASTGATRR